MKCSLKLAQKNSHQRRRRWWTILGTWHGQIDERKKEKDWKKKKNGTNKVVTGRSTNYTHMLHCYPDVHLSSCSFRFISSLSFFFVLLLFIICKLFVALTHRFVRNRLVWYFFFLLLSCFYWKFSINGSHSAMKCRRRRRNEEKKKLKIDSSNVRGKFVRIFWIWAQTEVWKSCECLPYRWQKSTLPCIMSMTHCCGSRRGRRCRTYPSSSYGCERRRQTRRTSCGATIECCSNSIWRMAKVQRVNAVADKK